MRFLIVQQAYTDFARFQWAYILKGGMNIATVNSAGENFYDTLVYIIHPSLLNLYSSVPKAPGDLWYFPPGVPHVLQATSDIPEGAEFLLVSMVGGSCSNYS